MRTKYLGLAVMTVLLGAKALSFPRQSSTNDEVAKKSVGGIKDLDIRGLPMEPPCDHTERASNTTTTTPQDREIRIANTAPKAPQDPEPRKDDGKKDGERKDRERKVQAKAVDPEADPGLRAFMPDLTQLLPGPEVDSDGENTNDFDKRDDDGDDGDDGYPPYCCYPWELYCYPEDYCPGYY